MPRGGWLSYLRPQAGAEIPAGLRLIVGAVSGAALSLSYHGLYLSIYSWVCVAILLFSLFGAQPRVSFGCGFLHALLFVLTSVPCIATVLTAPLAGTSASNPLTTRGRITWAVAETAVLLIVALGGPRLVPQAQAHHFARAVQLNFPETDSSPADWFQAHAADLDEITRLSLAPSAQKPH